MKKESIKKLQNHFNQVKVYYSVGDRVHLKKSNVNGVITAVIFKNDRNYPYLKIKWDTAPCEPGKAKVLYDPFDVVKEIKPRHKEEKKKKTYENFYLNERR